MKKGAIFIHREIQEHWIWKKKPFSFGQAWVDMLLLANYKEKKVPFKGEITVIGRGEFIRTERDLANRWGWSRSRVTRFIDLLKSDSMIEKISNQKANQIKIINYDSWQTLRTEDEPIVNQERTKSEPRVNLNNKDNKEKNIKEAIKEKHKYLDYVFLTENQYVKLEKDYGDTGRGKLIWTLDNYIGSNPKKRSKMYTDHNRVLRGWVAEKVNLQGNQQESTQQKCRKCGSTEWRRLTDDLCEKCVQQ